MEIGRHRVMMVNEHVTLGSNLYEKVKTFKYLRSLLTNQSSTHKEIKCRNQGGNHVIIQYMKIDVIEAW